MNGIGVFTTKKGVVDGVIPLRGQGLGLSLCKPKSYEKKDYALLFRLWLLYLLCAMGPLHSPSYSVGCIDEIVNRPSNWVA